MGTAGADLGATVVGEVVSEVVGEVGGEAGGEVVTLVGMGPGRVGVSMGLPAHDLARAMHAIITTAKGRRTSRASRQETLGSRGPRSLAAVPVAIPKDPGSRVANQ